MLNQTSKMTIAESNTLPRLKPQPQAGSARVAVVIVVWNAKHYVMECLESLREHCEQACSEVIVVDNASTDGTPELVAEMFPEFKLIRNPENFGFAKANNIGMAQSLAEYVCLVNSDVKFLDDSISPMVRYLDDHSEVGMLGPKMLAPTGEVRRSTMRFPTVWNNFCRAFGLDSLFKKSRLFGGMLMSDFDHQTTVPVEVLNGWFILVRRSAIERVGGSIPSSSCTEKMWIGPIASGRRESRLSFLPKPGRFTMVERVQRMRRFASTWKCAAPPGSIGESITAGWLNSAFWLRLPSII